MTWHSDKGVASWNESAAYVLEKSEVQSLLQTSRELCHLIHAACARIAKEKLWRVIGLRDDDAQIVAPSWERGDFSLCGRFDFLFDENGVPKLLEYNAETALSLVETARIQRFWLSDVMPKMGQCNELESALRLAWQRIRPERVHCVWRPRHAEVEGTVRYMADILSSIGASNSMMALHRMGWDSRRQEFVDEDRDPIRCCYKIYPWRWMLDEPFARHVNSTSCRFIEPPWRLMAASKGILCVLSDLYPDHAAVLPCARQRELLGPSCVAKPLFGHEGQNITISKDGAILETSGGQYSGQEQVFQKMVSSSRFDGFLPQFGVWIVDNKPVAIGIRETSGFIISGDSAFVPHVVIQDF